ncbi:MAG: Zn-dependent exopeptidase M28 [Oscillospiraceae bacterium]|nr:Zn-dependent exopeptidase M28 [Oscillospiraceae bacterium]
MTIEQINNIFNDTAYVRMGGSDDELKCAEYIKKLCKEMNLGDAYIEPFEVDMATIKSATLTVDGIEIPCKGYFNCGSGEVSAPIYYLNNADDKYQLSQCKGKIVIFDGYLRHWLYQDLLENGALGFISYDGNANYVDEDIDQRELRAHVSNGNKILGVNINAKKAIEIINRKAEFAKIAIEQDEYKGESRNVILDIPGICDEYIVFTAHYDSTSLSQGAYDNMSGSVGLLGIAEHFMKTRHKYGLRFIWCGSEERGLLGAKAYCAAHEEELKKVVLNINLDMIGCIMGKFISCCTTEEKLVHYIDYLSLETGFGVSSHQGVYSSDSTPFADKGVPALSFARIAPPNTATIHNSYDTKSLMSAEQMQEDIWFINQFTERMANAVFCPVAREIPDNMKDELDVYLARKRKGAKK